MLLATDLLTLGRVIESYNDIVETWNAAKQTWDELISRIGGLEGFKKLPIAQQEHAAKMMVTMVRQAKALMQMQNSFIDAGIKIYWFDGKPVSKSDLRLTDEEVMSIVCFPTLHSRPTVSA